MSHDLLKSALEEEERLLQELRATTVFRKLEAVRALIALYKGGTAPVFDSVHSSVSVNRPQPHLPERPPSRASTIARAAADHLRLIGRRAQSSEIMQALERQGFEFYGEKPTAALASVLSHNSMFDNVRGPGQGYGLKEWSKAGQSGSGESAESSTQSASGVTDHEPPQNRVDTGNTDGADSVTAAPTRETAA